MRIIREYNQWSIVAEYRIVILGFFSFPQQSVVGNIEGSYEDALTEFFRLLNNTRKIKEALLL